MLKSLRLLERGGGEGGGAAYLVQIVDKALHISRVAIWCRSHTPFSVKYVAKLVFKVRGWHVETAEPLQGDRRNRRGLWRTSPLALLAYGMEGHARASGLHSS